MLLPARKRDAARRDASGLGLPKLMWRPVLIKRCNGLLRTCTGNPRALHTPPMVLIMPTFMVSACQVGGSVKAAGTPSPGRRQLQ